MRRSQRPCLVTRNESYSKHQNLKLRYFTPLFYTSFRISAITRSMYSYLFRFVENDAGIFFFASSYSFCLFLFPFFTSAAIGRVCVRGSNSLLTRWNGTRNPSGTSLSLPQFFVDASRMTTRDLLLRIKSIFRRIRNSPRPSPRHPIPRAIVLSKTSLLGVVLFYADGTENAKRDIESTYFAVIS